MVFWGIIFLMVNIANCFGVDEVGPNDAESIGALPFEQPEKLEAIIIDNIEKLRAALASFNDNPIKRQFVMDGFSAGLVLGSSDDKNSPNVVKMADQKLKVAVEALKDDIRKQSLVVALSVGKVIGCIEKHLIDSNMELGVVSSWLDEAVLNIVCEQGRLVGK